MSFIELGLIGLLSLQQPNLLRNDVRQEYKPYFLLSIEKFELYVENSVIDDRGVVQTYIDIKYKVAESGEVDVSVGLFDKGYEVGSYGKTNQGVYIKVSKRWSL